MFYYLKKQKTAVIIAGAATVICVLTEPLSSLALTWLFGVILENNITKFLVAVALLIALWCAILLFTYISKALKARAIMKIHNTLRADIAGPLSGLSIHDYSLRDTG